jgi:hypothetical protein
MTAKIQRLRPKRYDAICESLQLALDLPLELRQETRDDIAHALGRFQPPDNWIFAMINPDQQRAILKAIQNSPRPFATVMVWNACISRLNYGSTAEVMASRQQLSEDTGMRPQEVSAGLSRLVEIGALVKIGKGRYAINPHVAWQGPLVQRQEAAKEVQFRLIE